MTLALWHGLKKVATKHDSYANQWMITPNQVPNAFTVLYPFWCHAEFKSIYTDLSERPYVSRKSHITTKKCTHTKMSETFFVCFPYKIAWNWIFLYLVWVEMARNCKETVISNVLFHFQMACLFRIFPCDMTFNFWFFVHCFACHHVSFPFSRYLDRIVLLKEELSTEMFVISPYCDNYDNEIEKQFRMKANEKSGEELYFMCDSAFVMQMLLLELWMRVWWWRRRRWCCCLLSLISDDFLLWIWLVWPDLLNDALYAHDAYIISTMKSCLCTKYEQFHWAGFLLLAFALPSFRLIIRLYFFWGKTYLIWRKSKVYHHLKLNIFIQYLYAVSEWNGYANVWKNGKNTTRELAR